MKTNLLIDLHTHILPGVDDGARDLASAQIMLTYAKNLSIWTIVATPHLRRAREIDVLRAAFERFYPHAEASGICLLLGFELHYGMLEDLSRIRECTIEGTNLVLMELPESALMPNWESILITLVDKGLKPVIAHPERYRYIQNDIDYAAQLRSFGCELQIDARALTGLPFTSEQRCAQMLFREGLCDYIASDAHKPEDYRYFEKAFSKYKDRWPTSGLEPTVSGRPSGS